MSRGDKPDFNAAEVLFREAKSLLHEHGANAQLTSSIVQDSLGVYLREDPDFTLELASCMLSVATAQTLIDGSGANGQATGTTSLLQQGIALLDKLESRAPAITQSYILKTRAFIALSHWNAARLCIRR